MGTVVRASVRAVLACASAIAWLGAAECDPSAFAAPPPAVPRNADEREAGLSPAGTLPMAAAMIPPAGEGVARVGQPAIHAGEQLFEYIDGGAPQFLEYGFHEVASQELTLNGRTYIFDVYRMRDPLAAYGIFSVRRPPLAKQAPALAGFPASAVSSYQTLLAHGPYYVEIVAYESTPETARETADLARGGLGRLDSTLAPADLAGRPPFDLLPAGSVPGSARLARGPISLKTALRGGGTDAFRRAVERVVDAGGRQDPVWLVAEYALEPGVEVTLALLDCQPDGTQTGGPAELVASARQALAEDPAGAPGERRVVALASGEGWLVTEPGGESWFIAARRGAFWMGRAAADAEKLAAWVGDQAAKER